MFVFPKESLPKDPVFPADLKELGYFINEDDQIRMIVDPEQKFLFRINTNDRYNEVQREAMNTCIRDIVLARLQALGLQTLRLPVGATTTSQHVPILATSSLGNQTRLIVVFGEPTQDLGIWAYRTIGNEGINVGSAVDFAKSIIRNEADTSSTKKDQRDTDSGLILTNPGQLVWHCGGERAVSLPTWNALPMRYAVDPPMRMGPQNKIPGNETWQDHITYVFEHVLDKMTPKTAKIDIIGLAEGGLGAIRYLAENWQAWRSRISAICLTNPLHNIGHLEPPEFAHFIATRTRAYLISGRPLDSNVPGRFKFGCNCYSSGESLNVECIMPRAGKNMLAWLDEMHKSPGLEEVEVIVREDLENEEGKTEKNGNLCGSDSERGDWED
ncbi:hypothetical protein LOZ12_000791 [Ophidiomyces ophidiicola]|nr:hypothetical protein LOZ62_003076 [Ophidiomyces ophidiicola]KAI2032994.1 hypothetical protein LOZ45_000854 [Ophidiomyces ophidiicola]KAI2056627.1 hypothetical protein LOZ38_000107 [Ophidiomyces ophidiicola]KAI2060405.1 hypothetical protein LOZ44_000027 [Ophidiomyces ophidiicola]KAI2079082.1 hypothetical protein LOZ37_002069 [Ophidiomyces ophidiicola]